MPKCISYRHSIYFRTVSFQRLLSTLLNQLKIVYGPFLQTLHSTFDFYRNPARRKQIYYNIREVKCLLSYYIYCSIDYRCKRLLEAPEMQFSRPSPIDFLRFSCVTTLLHFVAIALLVFCTLVEFEFDSLLVGLGYSQI